jgi:uncharacterized protein YjbJ (UPF0337 family)
MVRGPLTVCCYAPRRVRAGCLGAILGQPFGFAAPWQVNRCGIRPLFTVRLAAIEPIETLAKGVGRPTVGTISRVFCRRHAMSGTKDKAKGLANEAVGNIKQGVGKVTDNDKLRAEGKAQELKGEAQQAGKVKDALKKP